MPPAPRAGAAGAATARIESRTSGDGSRPCIAVTLGDARGIGPEVVARALEDESLRAAADFRVVGPSGAGLAQNVETGFWMRDGGAALAGKLAGLAIDAGPEGAIG